MGSLTGKGKKEFLLSGKTEVLMKVTPDGKFHGQGVYVWPNGDKFSGIWKNGKKDGNGCFKT